jgi:hypothetical protein
VLGKYIFGGGYFCEWFYGHLEVVAAVAQIISKFRTSSVCCVLCVNPTGSLKWVWVGKSMKKKLEVQEFWNMSEIGFNGFMQHAKHKKNTRLDTWIDLFWVFPSLTSLTWKMQTFSSSPLWQAFLTL